MHRIDKRARSRRIDRGLAFRRRDRLRCAQPIVRYLSCRRRRHPRELPGKDPPAPSDRSGAARPKVPQDQVGPFRVGELGQPKDAPVLAGPIARSDAVGVILPAVPRRLLMLGRKITPLRLGDLVETLDCSSVAMASLCHAIPLLSKGFVHQEGYWIKT